MTACVHVRHHRSTMITVLYADKPPPQPAADDNIQVLGYAHTPYTNADCNFNVLNPYMLFSER